jgi:hypothetical protein
MIGSSITTWRLLALCSCLVLLLSSASLQAGDEDISPSAYQQFDPVTGFTITVDPNDPNRQGHSTTDGQSQQSAPATEVAAATEASRPNTWLYWVIVAIAGAGVLVWIRSKANKISPP